jgi:hypothetical protein
MVLVASSSLILTRSLVLRFASLNNVHLKTPKLEDSMESFVLAETLKYYYLLVRLPRRSPSPSSLSVSLV